MPLDREGPTTKADCLNRLYAALALDEDRAGRRFTAVVFHEAEDMVDPGAQVRFRRSGTETCHSANDPNAEIVCARL